MKTFADFHIHSHYSRATSKQMNIEELSKFAKIKGLNLLGTGDFTHPKWFEELKSKLESLENGFYEYNKTNFILTAEISNIYKDNGKTRKIHNIIMAPDFEIVSQINDGLKKWGRLDYDGRPIFGKSSLELMEMLMKISERIIVVPAHCLTPWFSLFGSMSGYDDLKDCYKEYSKYIYALETGLSADPEMLWRLSKLDKYSLISNSDSHSPWPHRIGRECNVFDDLKSYDELLKTLKNKDKKKFLFTVEVDPNYGKYHFDGHRLCGIRLSPEEAIKNNNLCPKCKKQLTLGVLHRIEELADRKAGFKPENAVPFIYLIPLTEVLSALYNKGSQTKIIWKKYMDLIEKFGNEFKIMIDVDLKEIENIDRKLAYYISRIRQNKVKIEPGFDGVYGIPNFESAEEQSKINQYT